MSTRSLSSTFASPLTYSLLLLLLTLHLSFPPASSQIFSDNSPSGATIEDALELKLSHLSIINTAGKERGQTCITYNISVAKLADYVNLTPLEIKAKFDVGSNPSEDLKRMKAYFEDFLDEHNVKEMCSLKQGLVCDDNHTPATCKPCSSTHIDSVDCLSSVKIASENEDDIPFIPPRLEEAKDFMESLKDAWRNGQKVGNICGSEISSDAAIQYSYIKGMELSQVQKWLEENLESRAKVRELTGRYKEGKMKICATQDNLVCIPNKIGLRVWARNGQCKMCNETKSDSSIHLDFKTVCNDFVGKLAEKNLESGGDPRVKVGGDLIVSGVVITLGLQKVVLRWLSN